MSTDRTTAHHMVHPGPLAPNRIEWATGKRLSLIRAVTHSNETTLADFVAQHARSAGVISGTGHVRGSFSRFNFTTGGPGWDGKAANYTFIREITSASGPMDIRFTFGLDQAGETFVHAHASFDHEQEGSEQGGHLFPSSCVMDGHSTLTLNGIAGLTLRQGTCPETLHSVFELEEPGERHIEHDTMFVRLRPNEDLTHGVFDAMRRAGATKASLHPSIGSLNAPWFAIEPVGDEDEGSLRQIDRVGMEVLSVKGVFDLSGPTESAEVLCTAIDDKGHRHSGKLAPGLAPICVTAELALEILA
ncbi:MAG: hypothetical protein AAFR13_08015 [Pseudomonadota bacterium]